MARYIGLPFVDGGRSFDGVDCEGLLRLVLTHEAGDPPLPPYGVVSAHGLAAVARAIERNTALPPWVSVETPRRFDAVLMAARDRTGGRPRTVTGHVGVMISESHVLHIEEATDSVAVPLTHASVRERIKGFVRHEELI